MSYLGLGIAVGLLSSFLGFGGGTIMVPMLPWIAGYDIKTAIATSLAVISLNSANNVYNFHRENLIRWPLVGTIATGALVMAYVGSQLTMIIPETYSRLSILFVFVLLTYQSFRGPEGTPQFLRHTNLRNKLFVGSGAGLASGLTGIGGGTLLVPLFLVGRWVKNEEVSPTGNAINMIAATAGALTLFFAHRTVSWRAVIFILVGAMITSHFARKKQKKVPEDLRRKIVGFFLLSLILIQIYELYKLCL